MSRGPQWTADEHMICKYLWERRDPKLSDTEVDMQIAAVLKTRDSDAIRYYRVRQGWIRPKKCIDVFIPYKKNVGINEPEAVKNPPRGDALPDIGVQVATLIQNQTLMEQTLWAINCKMGELIELQKATNATMKDELELWRKIDARSNKPAS